MDLESLLKPISEKAPCGPDLDADMDPDFDAAYHDVIGEIPDFYFQEGVERADGSRSDDKVFDPKSVDFRGESKKIDAVLTRSRDLRLLVLRTQWAVLAGQAPKMADSLQVIAALLEEHDASVHPTAKSQRRDTINELNDRTSMVQPLLFSGLTGTNDVTMRKILVARGEAKALQTETDLELGPLLDALGAPGNAKAVDKTFASLTQIRDLLVRIAKACDASEAASFKPNFDDILPAVESILATISETRTDLQVPDAAADEPATDEGEAEGSETDVSTASPVAIASAPLPTIVSQTHARRLLEGCELYFRAKEPSSAALLLVTQARLLIGRPLMEALQTLLPDQASSALIDFGSTTGFQINSDRLQSLSESIPEGQPSEAEQDPGPEDLKIVSPAEAAAAIKSVEDHYRRFERSSPIPVLLQRARVYMDRDFQSLVDELIPKE